MWFWPSCSSVASPWMEPSMASSTTWLHSGRWSLTQRYSSTETHRWLDITHVENYEWVMVERLIHSFTLLLMTVCMRAMFVSRYGEMQRHRSSIPWVVPGVVSSPWLPTTSSTTTVSGWYVRIWIRTCGRGSADRPLAVVWPRVAWLWLDLLLSHECADLINLKSLATQLVTLVGLEPFDSVRLDTLPKLKIANSTTVHM